MPDQLDVYSWLLKLRVRSLIGASVQYDPGLKVLRGLIRQGKGL